MFQPRTPSISVICQMAFVAASLSALAFNPPARGAILLLPVGGEARAAALPAALSTNARLLGAGPLPASLIVYGDSAALSRAAAGHHILVLAAPFAACGDAA